MPPCRIPSRRSRRRTTSRCSATGRAPRRRRRSSARSRRWPRRRRRDPARHRRRATQRPGTAEVRSPHAHSTARQGRAGLAPTTSAQAIDAALAAQRVVGGDAAARAAGDLPARRRAAGRPSTARSSTRRRCSASPRRRTRPRSTPRASRSTSCASTCTSPSASPPSSRLAAGHVEPARAAAARGLRLRGHAVQLHLDRRQPADGAGDDGQHRGVEAGARPRCCSAHYIMELLREAGLPDGVINFVPGAGADDRRRRASTHPRSGGRALHRLDRRVPDDVEDGRRATSPATGPTRASSARPAARTSSSRTRRPIREALAVAIVRGGFEYQGQKCSAASRVYVPESLWKGGLRDRVLALIGEIRVGDPSDFSQLHGRGHRRASRSTNIGGYIAGGARTGGDEDRSPAARPTTSEGYFVAADAGRERRPEVEADERGDLRAGGDPARLPRRRSGRRRCSSSTRPRRTRSPARCSRATARAIDEARARSAPRGRQLLHQRQADRRGRRPAAVRRRARVGHQRQGGLACGTCCAGSRRGRSRRRSRRRPTSAIRSCRSRSAEARPRQPCRGYVPSRPTQVELRSARTPDRRDRPASTGSVTFVKEAPPSPERMSAVPPMKMSLSLRDPKADDEVLRPRRLLPAGAAVERAKERADARRDAAAVGQSEQRRRAATDGVAVAALAAGEAASRRCSSLSTRRCCAGSAAPRETAVRIEHVAVAKDADRRRPLAAARCRWWRSHRSSRRAASYRRTACRRRR